MVLPVAVEVAEFFVVGAFNLKNETGIEANKACGKMDLFVPFQREIEAVQRGGIRGSRKEILSVKYTNNS